MLSAVCAHRSETNNFIHIDGETPAKRNASNLLSVRRPRRRRRHRFRTRTVEVVSDAAVRLLCTHKKYINKRARENRVQGVNTDVPGHTQTPLPTDYVCGHESLKTRENTSSCFTRLNERDVSRLKNQQCFVDLFNG